MASQNEETSLSINAQGFFESKIAPHIEAQDPEHREELRTKITEMMNDNAALQEGLKSKDRRIANYAAFIDFNLNQ